MTEDQLIKANENRQRKDRVSFEAGIILNELTSPDFIVNEFVEIMSETFTKIRTAKEKLLQELDEELKAI